MEAAQRISLYGTLFYVFLGIAVLGLALAVFFFIKFDIPTVRAMMTGKARRKTVERMRQQNAKTGNLRYSYPAHTGDTGKSGRTGKTGKSGPIKDKPRVVHPEPPPQQTEERPETSVLSEQQNTTVLQPDETQTTVLGSDPAPESESIGETAQLKQRPPVNIRFQLTETTLVIHTDEII